MLKILFANAFFNFFSCLEKIILSSYPEFLQEKRVKKKVGQKKNCKKMKLIWEFFSVSFCKSKLKLNSTYFE